MMCPVCRRSMLSEQPHAHTAAQREEAELRRVFRELSGFDLDRDPLYVPADDPPPVPRRSWGCVGAVLVSLAVWVLFIAIVVRVVGR